jgi:hypothetical protein
MGSKSLMAAQLWVERHQFEPAGFNAARPQYRENANPASSRF